MQPTAEANKLLLDGTVALAQVERNGIRIDTDYLERTMSKCDVRIKEMQEEMRQDDVYALWRKRYGKKTNLGSRAQLSSLLFGELGYTSRAKTDKGNDKLDESAFEGIDLPFAKLWLNCEKLKKANGTFLKGIRDEVCDGFLHPVFNLNVARTYRSSSDSPNFQNFPVRDPRMAKLIRRAFIARDGHQLVEIDYSGIEVRVAACYHKDPRMLEYINDPTKDMHRDMAAECYKTPADKVSKAMRHCGKNMFVFPQFYGDYYINNARQLWEAIDQLQLEVDGKPLKQHLKAAGIKGPGKLNPEERPKSGTFEKHIQGVEQDFWGNRFRKYDQWKKQWWEKYLRNGRVRMLTGFVVSGVMGRNDVINYPIQGAAFHCLLWSLIRLIKELKRRKMRSKIVGQIHDSMVCDVHSKEMDDFLELAQDVMVRQLKSQWEWIIVPLEVEAEVSPPGGSWYDKKEVKL